MFIDATSIFLLINQFTEFPFYEDAEIWIHVTINKLLRLVIQIIIYLMQ